MAVLVGGLLLLVLLMTSVGDTMSMPGLNLTSIPGGLPPEVTPQFILLTVDDLVNGGSRKLIRSVTDGRQTSAGCPLAATLFVKLDGSSCEAISDLHQAGYEIADHTVNHKRLVGREWWYVKDEIAEGRRQLAECGVPQEDIVGFRAPYLFVDPVVREVLHEQGFLYDSSLVESMGSSVSAGFAERVWPFDMGGGIPINCTPDGFFNQICEQGESWPGLWQVPVWEMTELDGPYAMDPGFDYDCMCHASQHSAFDILKANFDAAYSGNRAPFNIYVHPFWLRAESEYGTNVEQLQQFVDYVLKKPDVHFVTMRQLLAWTADPIPADELTAERLGCGNPGGGGPEEAAPE